MNITELQKKCNGILETVGKYFVGERSMLVKVLASALANGHVLFEDYPGLGKTLLVKVFAKAMGCDYRRIQFTPDLMPSDIVGTKVWVMEDSSFRLERGPVFTNILLADEINRSPPKVQSALLECMEERQVTIEGDTHRLNTPFFVLATQNPIELEGTYPLPEAQMDRFLLKLQTGYVKSVEQEAEIMRRRSRWKQDDPTELVPKVTDSTSFREMQQVVEDNVYVDDQIFTYISELVRKTRENRYVEVGSSPRGGISLFKVSRAHAAINGRDYVVPDDIKGYSIPALSHRMILKLEYAFDDKISPDAIVNEILEKVEAPKQVTRR
jgi:MoxR-like ATPase